MEYLLLVYGDEKRWDGMDKETAEKIQREYAAFGKAHAGAIRGGNALQPTGTAATVRVRNGRPLSTDGPFAETKEQLGGYYLIEASNREEAAAIAAKIPGASSGCVEVRPIMKFS
jgi:hypothetical protein